MSLRPIDMQIALTRVSDVKESKTNYLHREDIAHDNANKSLREESIKKQTSVNKMDASAKTGVSRDKKEKDGRERRKERDAENKERKEKMNGPYHSIDIRI